MFTANALFIYLDLNDWPFRCVDLVFAEGSSELEGWGSRRETKKKGWRTALKISRTGGFVQIGGTLNTKKFG